MRFTFVYTPAFVNKWNKLRLGDEDLQGLEKELSENPAAGDVIRGGGGLRKVRFAPAGRGKSGAYRVAYACVQIADAIYLFTIFAKKDQANLSAAETAAIRKLLAAIHQFHRKD